MRIRFAERVSAAEVERVRLAATLAAELRTPAWLVGGAVRDALWGRTSRDLDVTVEGDPIPLARALAEALGGKLTAHERFGTTVVAAGEYHFDVATARRETYPAPGALPVVTPACLGDDLARRDFTLNALALRLDPDLESLYDPLEGCADLEVRVLRGLHPATFRDDPTRIIRAARYAARLGCRLDEATASWLVAAVGNGALTTVTGTRLWLELRRLLWDESAPKALGLLQRWQALPALGLRAPSPPELQELYSSVASPSRPPVGVEGRALTLLGLYAQDAGALAEHYGLSAAERRSVLMAARWTGDPPGCVFAAAPKSSTLYEAFRGFPAPALLALWTRHPASRPALERHQALAGLTCDLNGQDLRQLGFAPSAGFAPALQAALRAKLDDHADRDEQLAVATELLTAWQRTRRP